MPSCKASHGHKALTIVQNRIASSNSIYCLGVSIMFDVSWTDPTRETVGQRKHRKESKDHHTNEAQQVRYEKGSESNGSFSQNRPSLLNLFGGTSKTNIVRSGSHSKLSTLRNDEKQARASRRISSYTISSILSEHISSTSSCPPTNFFAMGPPHSETGQLSGSEGDGTVIESKFGAN